jgi:two-component system nitrate/nitrite response regulator NarL
MKILIVDDHAVLREGLAALLQQLSPKVTTFEAGNASDALALVDEHPDLDVLLLDLMMPGIDGLQALSAFLKKRPTLRVIVLSSSEHPADVRKALVAGALGYVPKSAGQRELMSAIQMVLQGGVYVPTLLLNEVADGAQTRQIPPDNKRGSALTARQIEILTFISEGHSNKSIAAILGVSEKTVKTHITAIFKELKVVSRTQASVAGRKAGLIPS